MFGQKSSDCLLLVLNNCVRIWDFCEQIIWDICLYSLSVNELSFQIITLLSMSCLIWHYLGLAAVWWPVFSQLKWRKGQIKHTNFWNAYNSWILKTCIGTEIIIFCRSGRIKLPHTKINLIWMCIVFCYTVEVKLGSWRLREIKQCFILQRWNHNWNIFNKSVGST